MITTMTRVCVFSCRWLDSCVIFLMLVYLIPRINSTEGRCLSCGGLDFMRRIAFHAAGFDLAASFILLIVLIRGSFVLVVRFDRGYVFNARGVSITGSFDFAGSFDLRAY